MEINTPYLEEKWVDREDDVDPNHYIHKEILCLKCRYLSNFNNLCENCKKFIGLNKKEKSCGK